MLIVESWQEDGLLDVLLHVVHISEVASWSDPVLGPGLVDELLGDGVDDVACEAIEAVWNGINAHVWTTESYDVSDSAWHVALFGDVSGEETALRETNNIEFTVECLVIFNLLARFLSNLLEIVDDGADGWNTDFDALN